LGSVLNFKKSFSINLLLFLFLLIAKIPNLIKLPSYGLDPSWAIALHWAKEGGLKWGSEIIFTYGPLGFLRHPLLATLDLYKLSLIFNLFIHILFVLFVFLFVNSIRTVLSKILIISTFLLVYPISSDFVGLLAATLLIYHSLVIKENKPRFFFSFILLAILSLIKGTMFIGSILMILTTSIVIMLNRKSKDKLKLISSSIILFFLSFITFWIISGNNLKDLLPFIIGYFELSSGYNSAMSVNAWMYGKVILFSFDIGRILLILAWISLVIYIALMILFLYQRKFDALYLLILTFPILFLSYKHGFVRYDGHVLSWLTVSPFIFSIVVAHVYGEASSVNINNKRDKDFSKHTTKVITLFLTALILVNILTIYSKFPWKKHEFVWERYKQMSFTANVLADDNNLEKTIAERKKIIRQFYNVSNKTLEIIDQNSVDIFPWDIALLWAYNLNWSPRPVFQSYTAYTPYLDNINSEKIEKDPPDYILYSFKSIDGRYPLYDEPKTTLTLLKYYSYEKSDNKFILLVKKNHIYYNESQISCIDSKLDEWIEIPQTNGGVIIAYPFLNYTAIGLIKKVLYKADPLFIQYKLNNDRTTKKYRFIHEVASNGIIISEHLRNNHDAVLLFKGITLNNIKAFRITSLNSTDYKKEFKICFSKVYYTQQNKNFY